MRQALTPGIANEAFDILVRHCGAPESLRRGFLQCECDATTNGCSEYRFGGGLGSGGKFWNNDGRLPSGELIIVDVLEGRCRSLCDGSLTFALSDAPGED